VSTTAKPPAPSLPASLVDLLGEPESAPEPLGGGITNHNLRVRFGGRDVVVRLAGKDTNLLGIDRACEREATAAAAAAGVGPAVVAYLDDPPTLVTEFLPGAEDGWTWAVDDVVSALRGAPDPGWPALLGARVARIHDVLGADAVPSGPDAPAARRARADAALAGAVAATEVSTGVRLRNRRAALERGIRSLDDTAPGLEFPIHGDLHVGQVLASPDDAAPGRRRYTVIDFDGDPQLDAADRERADAAARDVAHLLVSLDLVAAVAQKRLRRADPAAWAWADRARRGLLDAYRAELARSELFDPALLPGFEAEQLAAELHYADRFLPAWRYAPDAAITHRYPSTNDHPEDPWTPPPFEPTSA